MMNDQIRSAQIALRCVNFSRSLEFFTERLGFRLEMIFPADDPQTAIISGYGIALRLESSSESPSLPITLRLFGDFSKLSETGREIYSPDGLRVIFTDEVSEFEIPEGTQEFVLTNPQTNAWREGRAGMRYRDLIPGRLGGRFIASHISIPAGGEVPDYIHYHKIRFQMIYCLSGWAQLVYQDQGEPFLMKAGDCLLQPPEIRHRVLKTSPKFEVLEIACPAMHETFADHQMPLPNEIYAPERIYHGQRFVHHKADKAVWDTAGTHGIECRHTGISRATGGLADVRVFRAVSDADISLCHSGELLFFFIIKGKLRLSDEQNKIYPLDSGSFVLPAGKKFIVNAFQGLELLQVRLPAE